MALAPTVAAPATLARRWRVRDLANDLVIEVATLPARGDHGLRGLWELDGLLRRAAHGETALRTTLLAVRRALGPTLVQGDTSLERLAEELRSALRAGRVVLRRAPVPTIVVAAPADDEREAIGPSDEADPSASKTWVTIRLQDQNGAPVADRPYRIVAPGGAVFDGKLDSNGSAVVKGLDPGSCQIWCPRFEPHASATHAVQPGEHASGIAEAYGFDDLASVWRHPDNADLQQQRPDAHVLHPGDSLAIPELKDNRADKPTGAKHTFTIRRSPLKLRLKLLDLASRPLSGVSVTVADASLTTDGDGLVETTVEKSARDVALTEGSAQPMTISVGALDPSDDATETGWRARLYNLGYLADSSAGADSDEMLIALQDFQAQYSLPLSGQLDDATKAQLVQTYGC
jgi:N-acetylmuramoyl-L-alanine amidase